MRNAWMAATLCLLPMAPALAASSVSVFGLVDIGFMSEANEGKPSRFGLESGASKSSRWGIRGTEDLGNGLKAGFLLESPLTATSGQVGMGGRLFGRTASISLSSATLGTVELGRQRNLGLRWGGFSSPFGVGWKGSGKSTTNYYGSENFGVSSRPDSAIYYLSPRFSGLQLAVGFSFDAVDEGANDLEKSRLLDLGALYANGALQLAVTWQQMRPRDMPNVTDNPSNLSLSMAYDLGVATLHAGYGHVRNPMPDTDIGGLGDTHFTATHDRDQSFQVGTTVPLGTGNLLAGYQWSTRSKIKAIAIGYEYPLSKRTILYAYANRISARFFGNAGEVIEDRWRRRISAGIQHSF